MALAGGGVRHVWHWCVRLAFTGNVVDGSRPRTETPCAERIAGATGFRRENPAGKPFSNECALRQGTRPGDRRIPILEGGLAPTDGRYRQSCRVPCQPRPPTALDSDLPRRGRRRRSNVGGG